MSCRDHVPAIEGPRPPRNLQDLLRYAVEVQGDSAPNNHVQGLDAETRKFLDEALKSMTVDIAKELCDNINILKKLETAESGKLAVTDYEDALDRLADLVDDIDTANDYFRLGGFDIINICLLSPSPGIRWRIAEIVATCTQNNPFCQTQAVSMKLVRPFLSMVDSDENSQCQVKAFYAVASIVRENPDGLQQFLDNDGFSVVLRAMQSNNEKLCIKTTFFLSSITSCNPEIRVVLYKMGFIEQVITLIRREHSENHEHLAATLLALIKDYDEGLAECRRPELELRQTLDNILSEYGTNEAFQEEMGYIKNIITAVYGDKD